MVFMLHSEIYVLLRIFRNNYSMKRVFGQAVRAIWSKEIVVSVSKWKISGDGKLLKIKNFRKSTLFWKREKRRKLCRKCLKGRAVRVERSQKEDVGFNQHSHRKNLRLESLIFYSKGNLSTSRGWSFAWFSRFADARELFRHKVGRTCFSNLNHLNFGSFCVMHERDLPLVLKIKSIL